MAVRHRAIDLIKQNARDPMPLGLTDLPVDDEIHPTAEDFSAWPRDPLELTEHTQRRQFLYDAIRRLDPLERSVIVALTLEGDSALQAERRLKLTIHQVQGEARRALKKLYEMANSSLGGVLSGEKTMASDTERKSDEALNQAAYWVVELGTSEDLVLARQEFRVLTQWLTAN